MPTANPGYMRSVLRAVVTGVTVGAVGLGSAWGAAVVSTPPLPEPPTAVAGPAADTSSEQEAAPAPDAAAFAGGERLPAGWFTVGSATTTLVPPADRWK